MARARNIKPGLYKNEDLAECSIWARFVFPGLWMLADRDGRLEDRPKRIKGELLPYDSVEVDPLLDELTRFNFIQRYEVDGQRYIQICKFSEHQTPHVREQASTIPAPEGIYQSTTKAVPSTDQGSSVPSPRSPDSLIPSSLIPDSLIGDIAPQAAPLSQKKTRVQRKASLTPLPDGFCISERVGKWAADKGHSNLQAHFENFVSACRAKGYTYADWDEALMTAIRNDWAKLTPQQVRASPVRQQATPAQLSADNEEAKRLLFGSKQRPEVIDV